MWNLLLEVKGLDRGSHEDDLPSGNDVYLADEAQADECDDTPELIDHTPIRPAAPVAVEAPAPANTLTSTPMRDMISVAIPRSLVDVILPPQLPVSHHLPDDASSVGAPSLMHLHGLSTSIISDRDMQFTSHLWRTSMSLLGTEPTFSSSYHPQSDGQIDDVNRSMRKQLWSSASASLIIWDMILLCTECTYHPSLDHTSGVSPVEIAHVLAPRKPLDIVPLDPHVRVSRVRVAFAQHVSQLHQDIHDSVLS